MSNRLFDPGRQGLIDGSIDVDTNTLKVINLKLDGTATDVGIKAITGVTNASPMVVTSNSHGFSNGDIVPIMGVLGCTAANGTWEIANVAANTFELKTVGDQLNSTGNGAYSSGGCAINLTLADNLDDIDGARVGSDSSALTSPTTTKGTFDADDVTFSSVTGTIHGHVIYKDTGVASSSRLLYFIDGKTQVVVAADAASSATTIWTPRLEGAVANGTAMIFSNGVTGTLSSGPSQFARSLAVTALANSIAAGHHADVQTNNSGLPLTLTNGSFTLQFDSARNKIFTA